MRRSCSSAWTFFSDSVAGAGILFDEAVALVREGFDALLLVRQSTGVVAQRAFFTNEFDDLFTQTVGFGPYSLGAQGTEFSKARRVERVGRIDIGEDDSLDFSDKFAADMVVGTEPLDEFLRKVADQSSVALFVATPYARDLSIAPSEFNLKVVEVALGALEKATRLLGNPALCRIRYDLGKCRLA